MNTNTCHLMLCYHRWSHVGEYASSWLKAERFIWVDAFKSILPWGSREPFVGNRSYNWQCCPISSARSLNSSSKCTAKLLWSHCLCIFNISSPTRIWKEIKPWNHSGYSKWKNLRKIPISPSQRYKRCEENSSMDWLLATELKHSTLKWWTPTNSM